MALRDVARVGLLAALIGSTNVQADVVRKLPHSPELKSMPVQLRGSSTNNRRSGPQQRAFRIRAAGVR